MKKEYADKWIAALRSGNYKQGDEYLCYDDENGNKCFCALGVLCDVVGIAEWEVMEDSNIYEYEGYQMSLNNKVVEMCEIKSWNEEVYQEESYIDQIVRMNDSHVSSFPEIADFIEANYQEI